MNKTAKIGLGIIGFIGVVALAAPWLMTWNQYKNVISQKVYEATGRELQINGNIRIGLLPAPYASVTDVIMKNPAGALSENFATIESLDIGVALMPLLSKKIEITHITLDKPAITLETMPNGGKNWEFKKPETAENANDSAEDSASTTQLSIDAIRINDAYLRVIDSPKKTQSVYGPLNGLFKVGSLQGPIQGSGSLTVNDLPIRFETTIESLPEEANGFIPFTLALTLPWNTGDLRLKGSYQKGDTPAAQIEIASSIKDLEKLMDGLNKDTKAPQLPPYLKKPITTTGTLAWRDTTATIDNLMVQAGGMEAQANIRVTTGNTLSVVGDINRLVFPPEAAAEAVSAKDTPAKANVPLAETLRNTFATATGFLDTALPKMPVNVVLTAATLALPNQPTIRDFRLAASNTQSGLTIQSLQAKLPGNSALSLTASLPTREDGKIATAQVTVDLSTQNIQAALGQASTGRNKPMALQTTAVLTREMVRLKPLRLTQNNETVTAELSYNPKKETALVMAVSGSALNLDNLLGDDTASSGSASKENAPTPAKTNSNPLKMLDGLKADVRANLGAVTFKGKTVRNVTLATTLSDDGIALNTAKIGDIGGMVVDAKGNIASISPLSGVAIAVTGDTPNLSKTLQSLGNAEAKNLGASRFDGTIKGDSDRLNIALNGTIDQGKIALNATASDLDALATYAGTVDITHPETATIVRNFGGLAPQTALGPFALKTDFTYGADTIKANDLVLQLGQAGTVNGDIAVIPQNGGRTINATLKADKLALAALMGDDTTTQAQNVQHTDPGPPEAWSREPINLEGLRNLNGKASITIGELLYKKFVIRDFETTAQFSGNTINLNNLSGDLFDAGRFSANGTLVPGAAGQAHKGNFTLNLTKVDAHKLFVALGSEPLQKGVLNAKQTLQFNGASQYAIINSLNGDGTIDLEDAIVNGIDLDSLADKLDRPNSLTDFAAIISQARAGGTTPISDVMVPVTIRNGIVQVQNTTIKTQKTAMALNGVVNLPPKTVNLTGNIQFTEQRNLPPLTLMITGPMNAPQKNFDTRSFTQFYAQKATEKLQGRVQDKLNDFLGLPKASEAPAPAPAATETPASPADTQTAPPPEDGTNSGMTSPTTPVAPTTPTPPTTTPQQQPRQAEPKDQLKELGGQLLNDFLGGGQR